MSSHPKIAILGAGAMGGLIGGLMQRAGYPITYIARGATLQGLREQGITLVTEGDRWHGPAHATDNMQEAGTQDILILCTKAHQLQGALPQIEALMHEGTIVVPAINGLPWWYFQKQGGEFDGRTLEALDPGGKLAQAIAPERIIGCVNYLAGHISGPGEITYVPSIRGHIALGELDGAQGERLAMVGKAFEDAGFAPRLTDDIRQTVWHKLWGNIAFNPIGALTHGTIDQLAEGYYDIDLLSAVMNETRFIADKLGIAMNQTIKSRVDAAAKMRGHKTSMQMDIEAGRRTEIEAIVGAVRGIAKWMEVDTPYLNTLYSLVKLKERFYMAAGSGQA